MGNLTNRHKKPGGFRKLVNSLETTVLEKRSKIIEMMRQEDPEFIEQVEASLFNFDDFMSVDDLVLCEILGFLKDEPRTLAVALYHASNAALIDKFTKNMPPALRFNFKDETENLRGVTQREQIAARFRIIQKTRDMEKPKRFNLKKYSSQYPDD
jgi:flagellar motor switch protein FliG